MTIKLSSYLVQGNIRRKMYNVRRHAVHTQVWLWMYVMAPFKEWRRERERVKNQKPFVIFIVMTFTILRAEATMWSPEAAGSCQWVRTTGCWMFLTVSVCILHKKCFISLRLFFSNCLCEMLPSTYPFFRFFLLFCFMKSTAAGIQHINPSAST